MRRKDGKVLADRRNIIGPVADRRMRHGHHERAASQAPTSSISVSRRPACSIPSTASPTNAWISSDCGFLFWDAARCEIEQEIIIQGAGRSAVSALHVVRKDFELRLVVGLGRVRKQERMRGHFGIGLLRAAAAR